MTAKLNMESDFMKITIRTLILNNWWWWNLKGRIIRR
jgi:hypothetical protein